MPVLCTICISLHILKLPPEHGTTSRRGGGIFLLLLHGKSIRVAEFSIHLGEVARNLIIIGRVAVAVLIAPPASSRSSDIIEHGLRYLSMKISDDGLDGVGALMFLQVFINVGLAHMHVVLKMIVKVDVFLVLLSQLFVGVLILFRRLEAIGHGYVGGYGRIACSRGECHLELVVG